MTPENRNTPLLELQALSTGYGKGRRQCLVGRDLNGRLHQGELTVLVGRNGCGKSTLLRTLAGFVPPVAGRAVWLGQDLRDLSVARLARTAAIVLTSRPDTDYLTARELVETGRMPHTGPYGRLRPEDRAAVERAIEATGMRHLADRRFVSLSDGERQRVMTAKALAQDTPAILMDEPTAFLDFPAKIEMLRLLKQLARKQGRGVLLATHDLEPALRAADRVWLLTQTGLQQGSPEQLANSGQLERFFADDGLRLDRQPLTFTLTQETADPVPPASQQTTTCL